MRELENTVAALLATSLDGTVDASGWLASRSAVATATPTSAVAGLRDEVAAFELGLIADALQKADGNQSEAARRLKLTRPTLIEKLKRHGLL